LTMTMETLWGFGLTNMGGLPNRKHLASTLCTIQRRSGVVNQSLLLLLAGTGQETSPIASGERTDILSAWPRHRTRPIIASAPAWSAWA
jgi:hypothetical protein